MGFWFPGTARRHAATLAAAALLLGVTHYVVTDARAQYAAYLVVFAIWMVWFVTTVVDLIRALDR